MATINQKAQLKLSQGNGERRRGSEGGREGQNDREKERDSERERVCARARETL